MLTELTKKCGYLGYYFLDGCENIHSIDYNAAVNRFKQQAKKKKKNNKGSFTR